MTVAEIKKTMTDAFMADASIKKAYGLDPDKTFEQQFSSASLENILFYVIAVCNWVTRGLFDRLKVDVLAELNEHKAHTANWYASRAMLFQLGRNLAPDSDKYDNTGVTPDELEKEKIIKYAAAMESKDGATGVSKLLLKIAGETNGKRAPIGADGLAGFADYVGKIKDAGVWVEIINVGEDLLELELDIYYNPLVLDGTGKRLDDGTTEPVPAAINGYIENLSFNGRYTNQGLTDALQVVDGVEVVELRGAWWNNPTSGQRVQINKPVQPYAGYFEMKKDGLKINYIANE